MDDYRRLRAWCIVLTIGATTLLLWLLPSIALGVIVLMLIVSLFEWYFLWETFLQAQARDQQRFRNSAFSARPESLQQFVEEED